MVIMVAMAMVVTEVTVPDSPTSSTSGHFYFS